jgi:hypothetical protein
VGENVTSNAAGDIVAGVSQEIGRAPVFRVTRKVNAEGTLFAKTSVVTSPYSQIADFLIED